MTKYRSQLEQTFHAQFKSTTYEKHKLEYVVTHTYTPDFCLGPNLFVECKGVWDSADRSKHLYIKKQHPEVRILFVFQNPRLTLSKKSKTTYGDWATKHGYHWLHIRAITAYSCVDLARLLQSVV